MQDAKRYLSTPKYHKNNRSAYSTRKVAEQKHKMELIYGKGLVGLYDDHGKMDPARLGWHRKAQATWVEIGGQLYDASNIAAFFFAFVEGSQYSGLTDNSEDGVDTVDVMSNCFYAMSGMVDNIYQLIYDYTTLGQNSGEYNWFNIVFYDPIHSAGGFIVLYE